jgi:hypothetical protein
MLYFTGWFDSLFYEDAPKLKYYYCENGKYTDPKDPEYMGCESRKKILLDMMNK